MSVATAPNYPPQGKTAIVTGGSSGIGRSTAIALARAGWNVVVTGRRAEQLQETVELIDEATGRRGAGRLVQGDICQEAVVADVFERTKQQYGRVDMVFCNAGVGAPAVPITDLPLEKWQAAINTNLTASFLCAREAVRVMSAQSPQGGRIIINGSITLDCRQHNIAVSQIDIGNASTDLTARMERGQGVAQADGSMRQEPTFDREYAAQEVVHIAEMPLSVNVMFVTIQATNMPSYVGRG